MTKLIIPPKDIRVIIEKTAGFVAKNGSEFEAKIHENERHNPKFAFMSPNDPYNMFYRKRLQELIEGGSDAIMKAITDSKASEAHASSQMDHSEIGMETFQVPDGEKEIGIDLEKLEFLIDLPTISLVDLDVLKLTAQFAAKNGKQFILHLSQKESRNPQFDFLKPNNYLFPYYQALVRQYTLILSPSKDLLERVKRCAFNKNEHLKLVKKRSQIERLERKRIQDEEFEKDVEREAFNKIDWHDFSIAESVTFGPEDQHKNFPGPLNPQVLQTMSLTQRLEMWTGKLEFPEAVDDEEEMEIDEPSDFSAPLIVSPSLTSSNEIIMGAAFGSSIKVRTDYIPRATASLQSVPTQICEICKLSIPTSQIEEHVRIELLDPKWRTQRLAMLVKNRESNLVETGTDVSKNLEAIAKHRSDIFSSSNASSTSADVSNGPTRPIWDGRTDSVGQINRAAQIFAKPQIEKEMTALQRSGDYSLDPTKGSIGPRQPTYQQPQYKGYHPQVPAQGYSSFIPAQPHMFPPGSFPPLPPGSILHVPTGIPPFPFPPGHQLPPGFQFPPGSFPPPPPPPPK